MAEKAYGPLVLLPRDRGNDPPSINHGATATDIAAWTAIPVELKLPETGWPNPGFGSDLSHHLKEVLDGGLGKARIKEIKEKDKDKDLVEGKAFSDIPDSFTHHRRKFMSKHTSVTLGAKTVASVTNWQYFRRS